MAIVPGRVYRVASVKGGTRKVRCVTSTGEEGRRGGGEKGFARCGDDRWRACGGVPQTGNGQQWPLGRHQTWKGVKEARKRVRQWGNDSMVSLSTWHTQTKRSRQRGWWQRESRGKVRTHVAELQMASTSTLIWLWGGRQWEDHSKWEQGGMYFGGKRWENDSVSLYFPADTRSAVCAG